MRCGSSCLFGIQFSMVRAFGIRMGDIKGNGVWRWSNDFGGWLFTIAVSLAFKSV